MLQPVLGECRKHSSNMAFRRRRHAAIAEFSLRDLAEHLGGERRQQCSEVARAAESRCHSHRMLVLRHAPRPCDILQTSFHFGKRAITTPRRGYRCGFSLAVDVHCVESEPLLPSPIVLIHLGYSPLFWA